MAAGLWLGPLPPLSLLLAHLLPLSPVTLRSLSSLSARWGHPVSVVSSPYGEHTRAAPPPPRHVRLPLTSPAPPTTTFPLSTPPSSPQETLATLFLPPRAVLLLLCRSGGSRRFAGEIRHPRSPRSPAVARIWFAVAPSSSSTHRRAPGSTAAPPASPSSPSAPSHAVVFSGCSPPFPAPSVSSVASLLFPYLPRFHSTP